MAYRATPQDFASYADLIPCQSACPVGTDARGYVRAIAAGDFERAYLIARGPNPLASVCGRVCGAPCEAACRRGTYDAPIAIRALKRTATERFGSESGRFGPRELLERVLGRAEDGGAAGSDRAAHACEGREELRSLAARLGAQIPGAARDGGGRIAVIGSGPAGLAAAHDLALLGHRPVVFEMEPEPAGMLLYGIPEYRLPRDLIRAEVDVIRALGVEFRCGVRIGADVAFDALVRDHDAVVIAIGAKSSRALRLPGAEGPGVMGGVEFLRGISLGERPVDARDAGDAGHAGGLGRRVVVIGGGNVAYDVARTTVRQLGSDVSRSALRQAGVVEVTLVSLESLEEMPADDVEIQEGEEEGVRRLNSLGPVAVERDGEGRVTGVRFQRCERVFDADGRFAPLFDEADQTTVACDMVLIAIGQTMDASFVEPERDGVLMTARGFDLSKGDGATSRRGVFVAGDAAYGPKLLIHAVADGKKVARAVHKHLTGVDVAPELVGWHAAIEGYEREPGYEKIPRAEPKKASAAERVRSQGAEVELGLEERAAMREASRCFDCGVNTVFDGLKCVLCGGCVDVCPESCLKIVSVERLEPTPLLQRLRSRLFGDDDARPVSAILKDEDLCIRCGLCAERCPNGAVTMERFSFCARTA